jgi:hypothetical protein
MADKAALNVIGLLLCAATLFVIAVGGFVVRVTLTSDAAITGNTYGLQAIRVIDTPRLRTLAADRS